MFRQTDEHRLGKLPKPTSSPVNEPPVLHVQNTAQPTTCQDMKAKGQTTASTKSQKSPQCPEISAKSLLNIHVLMRKRTIFRHLLLTGLRLQHQEHHHCCLNLPFCCLESQFITKPICAQIKQCKQRRWQSEQFSNGKQRNWSVTNECALRVQQSPLE